MSLSFPVSPTVGQNYQQWAWDGVRWVPAQGTKQIGARVLLMQSIVVPASPVANVQMFYAFNNTYDQYELEIYDLQLSAEQSLFMRVSTDGSTFDATTSNSWSSGYSSYSYPTNNNGGPWAQAGTGMVLSTLSINPTAAVTFKAQVRFSMPWTTDRAKLFDSKGQHYSGANGYCCWMGANWYAASNAPLKGLQILPAGGNITRGVFNLYGIVKAGAGGS